MPDDVHSNPIIIYIVAHYYLKIANSIIINAPAFHNNYLINIDNAIVYHINDIIYFILANIIFINNILNLNNAIANHKNPIYN